MQILILSDTHANWYALEAVLADAEGQYDRVVCCGDIVGYNPHPVAVLEWTRENCPTVIRGNHDKVVAGIEDIEWFNRLAQQAVLWTRRQLDERQLSYLRDLPKGPLQLDGFEIWHGATFDEDEYVMRPNEAMASFGNLETDVGFFGHTHLQGGFYIRGGRVGSIGRVPHEHREKVIQLEPDTSYMINPGSVGQPRDGDSRAAYALYNPEEKLVIYRRVPYAIDKTVEDLKRAGLPDSLWLRLLDGI